MVSRGKVREVFDAFDTDGSGTVSTDELQRLITACGLDITEDDIDKIVEEADVDGSGEVEFDEFYECLKKQQASGSGGLLTVAGAAGSMFGWLNPGNWFAASEESTAATSTSASPTPPQQRARAPPPPRPRPLAIQPPPGVRSRSPGASSERRAFPTPKSPQVTDRSFHWRGSESERQHGGSREKVYDTVRSKAAVLSAWLVLQQNKQQAEEQRQMENEMRETLRKQQQHFLEKQQQRIKRFEQDEIASRISQEKFKATKRAVGLEMRKELAVQHEEVQVKNRAYVKVMAEKTRDVRRAKRIEIAERHKRAAETARETGIQAQIERRRHREEALATVRKQEQAAKDYAANVRFETRPEVRKDTRDFFQAQRNAVCAEERLQQQRDKLVQEQIRQQFLEKTAQRVADVKHTREMIQQKRLKLVQKSRQEAERVKRQLQEERERNLRNAHNVERVIKQQHDVVIDQRYNPRESGSMEVESILREQGSLDIRSSVKRQSQQWAETSRLSDDDLFSS